MKVLLVCDSDTNLGGAEKHVRQLRDHLKDADLDVSTITFGEKQYVRGGRYVFKEGPGFMRHFWKFIVNPGLLAELREAIRIIEPDVVHIHNINTFMPTVLKAIEGYPIVLTAHDFSLVCPTQWNMHEDGKICKNGFSSSCFTRHRRGIFWPVYLAMVAYYRIKSSRLKRITNATISPSPLLASYLKKKRYPNIIVLPHYVQHKSQASKKNKGEILFLGKLEKNKGGLLLVDEFIRAVRMRHDLKLHVAGTGTELEEMKRRLREAGMENKAVFHGNVKDVTKLYRTAETVVMPSLGIESFGYVIVEALQHGCSVIASNTGTFPWLLQDGEAGTLFNPLKRGDLAEKLVKSGGATAASLKRGREFDNKDEYVSRLKDLYSSDDLKRKISFVGRFSDNPFEGMMKMVTALKQGLKESFRIVMNDTRDADLVHVHSSGFSDGLNVHKHPSVYSLHANFGVTLKQELRDTREFHKYLGGKDEYHGLGERMKKSFYRIVSISTPLFVKRLCLRKFDAVVVPNEYMRRLLGMKNCLVINHGIDLGRFKPSTSSRKRKRVAYIGHLATSKGLLEAVKALSQIKGIDKRVYLTKVTRKFRQHVKKIDPSIKVFGKQKDVVKMYNDQDLILLPFRHESAAIGTPLVLIEAMACGKTIITTDLAPLKEYCGNSVEYVKPYDVKGIVQKVRMLLKYNKTAAGLGKRAAKQAEKFNKDRMQERYTALYKELL